MDVPAFENKIERMCQERVIPGVLCIASDTTGSFQYKKAFGVRTLKEDTPHDLLKVDATMWLASCTKLIGTIAVMQLVEQGKIGLDSDITEFIPELKGLEILKGFETIDGVETPILEGNERVITLKMLLTHQSGLSYQFFNPNIIKHRALTGGETPAIYMTSPDLISTFKTPLTYVPGEGWEYSSGIDWAGLIVERISGMELETYFQKHIWDPLDVRSMTFFPAQHPEIAGKLVDMSLRAGGSTAMGTAVDPNGKMEYTTDTVWNPDMKFASAGAGLYGAPLDYQKLLHSLCVGDEKILENATLDLMFQDHLAPAAKTAFEATLEVKELRAVYGVREGQKVSWGIGGMVYLEDVEGGRRKGTMNWGGYPGLFWFCDRVSGVSGVLASQIIPPGDEVFKGVMEEWEGVVYRNAGKV
ncbi:beta-lactamase/transpeptidase-like protein [Glarea lozoyensis ATCC 20868]|uniref:Beta-lactamase/transpeptidase-like protein n=1 Tax=Glarea lozoyensis (strain ATCC 20868 / MF5171) TaxID=1116229 RepID=S3CYI8_GLAL2|nr:beta-lactamase/transpeptidase-like protein [Glarea lozoyensis ATCC 20868]EPE24881.1 beta-lactamase/transpeptidase-like protein [Glarea lozoyensis ATCC 20868]